MSSIAQQVGTSRIIVGGLIPYPVGNPNLPADREKIFRKHMVSLALKALQTEVGGPTVFSLDMENKGEM